MIPASLRDFALSPASWSDSPPSLPCDGGFRLHPHYSTQRPLEATLLKTQADLDDFVSEKYHDRIDAILAEWSSGLLRSPQQVLAIGRSLGADFLGASLRPAESRALRPDAAVEVRQNKFADSTILGRDSFLQELKSSMGGFSEIVTAQFQVTRIEASTTSSSQPFGTVRTRVRYELVGTGDGYYREQRVGSWDLEWEASPSSSAAPEFRLRRWHSLDETRSRSFAPVFVDITALALGRNPSYADQLRRGTDYWRTVLDGASGIDIYGHNGVSVADIDNDGFDDLYLCQPAGLPNRLYRNRGDGTFEDITEASGLGILENTACALFADFHNHGRQDVVVVRANGPLLFVNEGNGKFRHQPGAFQFANPPQGTFTGAAVADYDRDGWLDIYFCVYIYYQGTDQYKYPVPYHDAENGPPNFMMRNNRDGSFRDVTAESGLNQNNTRYSFCCGWNDYNQDGWPDLYVANDTGPNFLYHNKHDGTFEEIGLLSGSALSGDGLQQGSMGVDWGDYLHEGRLSMLVTNFTEQGSTLYHNQGNDSFADVSVRAKIMKPTYPLVSWGTAFFDMDNDGWLDIFIASGHVYPQVDSIPGAAQYRQPLVLLRNHRDGTFEDVSSTLESLPLKSRRGVAFGDINNDGNVDVVVLNVGEAPSLLLNHNQSSNHRVLFKLVGTKSNKAAIGARVTVKAGSLTQFDEVRGGASYLSQNDLRLHFGLGDNDKMNEITIRWPNGETETLREVAADFIYTIVEGAGIDRKVALPPLSSSFIH